MPVQHTPVYVTEAERLEQENAARQVRDLPERPRTYHIVTYGCQMNAHDSEKLAGILSGMGMAEAADRREADLVIFNTCCVRDNAERRALGNVTWLKELKKDKPGLIIGVCGCMVQQPGMAERIVDITATGTTLRENNLEIVEEVLASTARFFANGCALRTDERIVALARVLAENAPKHTYAPIAGASNPTRPSQE